MSVFLDKDSESSFQAEICSLFEPLFFVHQQIARLSNHVSKLPRSAKLKPLALERSVHGFHSNLMGSTLFQPEKTGLFTRTNMLSAFGPFYTFTCRDFEGKYEDIQNLKNSKTAKGK